jgi:predicted amino acid racemase
MSTPRLEIDLEGIETNARTLVGRLGVRGIGVTGVTKATLGSPKLSRIENIERLVRAGVPATMTLLRSPMPSQAARIVQYADVSFNSELDVISSLSAAATAARRTHRVVLMVELGDLREGIMPGDIVSAARETLRFPNIQLVGIGANLACQSGVVPDERNMAELSALVEPIESSLGVRLERVSGGNSGNLAWALSGADVGRINELRLGESILLGREPLHRRPIDGLRLDAFTLVAEVIEAKLKPSLPWGEIAQSAFGTRAPAADRGDIEQAILAVGRQDIDPDGVQLPAGMELLGASSDHLLLNSGGSRLPVGSTLRLRLNYSALVRAMTSPFVEKVVLSQASKTTAAEDSSHERARPATPRDQVGARQEA